MLFCWGYGKVSWPFEENLRVIDGFLQFMDMDLAFDIMLSINNQNSSAIDNFLQKYSKKEVERRCRRNIGYCFYLQKCMKRNG